YELGRLYEVQHAVRVFRDEKRLALTGDATSVAQVMNGAGFNVRRVIAFCKKIEAFERLSGEDQLTMLKSFYPEKSAVRVAFMFEPERDGWTGLGVSDFE